jgi:hypothetical protein
MLKGPPGCLTAGRGWPLASLAGENIDRSSRRGRRGAMYPHGAEGRGGPPMGLEIDVDYS